MILVMKKDPVVIIGGGFAGVYTAKELLKRNLPVLLISKTNHFTFTPLLHEVATGSLISHDVIFEYESFFKEKHFQFARGLVENIDLKKRTVSVEAEKIAYSQLVLALGATTNHWNIKGTDKAFTLKNVEDAVKLKKAILETAQNIDQHASVTVVGAGPTGLELVFDIQLMLESLKKRNENLHFTVRLIDSRKAVCSMGSKSVDGYIARALKKAGIEVVCGAYAQEITSDKIITTEGEFASDVTVLCAGVRPNTDVFKKILKLDDRGHIIVNSHLQVLDDPSVFAIGDAISIDGEPVPKLAQIAVREAPVVAANIARIHYGSRELTRTYTPKVLGTLFSLGFGDGVGQIQGRVVKGVLAWYLWRTVYLFKTPGLGNKLRVAFSWTLGLFQGRNLTEL